jgi:hypothetical protein
MKTHFKQLAIVCSLAFTINLEGQITTWNLIGNAGTTPPSQFVGTTDVQPLVFKTASIINTPVERLRITPTGSVGIGTTIPLAPLHVVGTYAAPNPAVPAGGIFSVGGTGTGLAFQTGVYASGSTPTSYAWMQAQYQSSAGLYYDIKLNPLGGNVAIGTSTTTAFSKLQVRTTTVVATTSDNLVGFSIEKQTSGTNTRRMFMVPHLGSLAYTSLVQDGDHGLFWSDGAATAGHNNSSALVLGPWANSTAGIRITAVGNVGVGVSNPEGMIHIQNDDQSRSGVLGVGLKVTNNLPAFENQESVVGILSQATNNKNKTISTGMIVGTAYTENFVVYGDGYVQARDIKVTLQTPFVHPDYVFEKGYKLMPLSMLEKYLKDKNHLPNIPSAKEVRENNGIDLGEMSEKQLEKIEELTLYIIEMNKKINELTTTVQLQQEQIQILKNK